MRNFLVGIVMALLVFALCWRPAPEPGFASPPQGPGPSYVFCDVCLRVSLVAFPLEPGVSIACAYEDGGRMRNVVTGTGGGYLARCNLCEFAFEASRPLPGRRSCVACSDGLLGSVDGR